MAISERQLLHFLGQMSFSDSAELAGILGEPHATVHRALADLLAEGIVGRVSHGTVHLPSSQRYHLTTNGISEAARMLGFATPSDFVRAYPVSREWLTLLIRRMDAVASIYRLAASLSPGIDGLPSRVEFHRRGRFDATTTLHDGRSFGVVRQGLALRRRSLYDRLRAIAEYDYSRRPGAVLILVPSVWEERLTTRFCDERNIRDCYVAVESRDALERRDRRLWCCTSWVIGSSFFSLKAVVSRNSPGGGPRTQSPERKRASLPRPERMAQAAPAFGVSPSEKRTLDLITDHPMIPREHLALWLGVSEGRVSQMMRSLVDTHGASWSARANGATPATPCPPRAFATSPTGTAPSCPRRRAYGAPPSPPTNRAAGVTWATASRRGRGRRSTPTASRGSCRSWRLRLGTTPSELQWSVPTARSDRAYNWGDSAIAPDAVGELVTGGLHIPFYFEHELRARHPRGVLARLRPYESYYWSPEHKDDQPPFPTTLFVVDTEEVEATYVSTAARMTLMTVPVFVSCRPVLSHTGILGRSWRPLWEPESPRRALSNLDAYQWDSLYHRMRPVL